MKRYGIIVISLLLAMCAHTSAHAESVTLTGGQLLAQSVFDNEAAFFLSGPNVFISGGAPVYTRAFLPPLPTRVHTFTISSDPSICSECHTYGGQFAFLDTLLILHGETFRTYAGTFSFFTTLPPFMEDVVFIDVPFTMTGTLTGPGFGTLALSGAGKSRLGQRVARYEFVPPATAPIPEPSTGLLLACGIGALALVKFYWGGVKSM